MKEIQFLKRVFDKGLKREYYQFVVEELNDTNLEYEEKKEILFFLTNPNLKRLKWISKDKLIFILSYLQTYFILFLEKLENEYMR